MRARRTVVVVAAALLTVLPFAGGLTPTAQANYCAGTKTPPELPPGPQTGSTLFIVGAYWHVGGTQLDALGCVNGQTVHDTRMLPPRADYVIAVLVTKCTPGSTFTGSVRGLGVNATSATFRCTEPNVWGHTAAQTGIYPLRTNLAGTISATATVGTRTLSTTSYTALPVSQPA